MKIMMIANDPHDVGGVMNYTRPLATKLVELGHTVQYLYSGTWNSKYDLRCEPYISYNRTDFAFECGEIINSECLPFNYGYPELDVLCQSTERLFKSYIENTKPDVVHIHSRVGFPASINMIAFESGAIVCNTIHTYGYICQKRVMIDYKGVLCIGPSDLNKCAVCTGTLNYRKERILALLRKYNKDLRVKCPGAFKVLQRIKINLKATKHSGYQADKKSNNMGNELVPQLAARLNARLKYCVDVLNYCSDRIICVSNDVKRTLMNYGVNERKLFVQHIGSIIAERQIINDQPLREPIVIGNIGGVNYYKGIHVLLSAIGKVRNNNFMVRIYGKYEEEYLQSLMERYHNLPIEFTGRYKPEELPEILKQIDVMVLPSICNDTAPQTIFESFSGGVPIIASNIGGFPDFVQHNHNGLLFEAGNSDDLAAKIDFILSNPDRLVNYKKNIPKLKTVTENANELIWLYDELLGIRNGSRKR